MFYLVVLIIQGMNLKRRTCLSALLATALPALPAQAQETRASVMDQTWLDAARQRELPVKVRWPDGATHPGPWPVLLFSQGLGGTRECGAVWGEVWAAAGCVKIHFQAGRAVLGVHRQSA